MMVVAAVMDCPSCQAENHSSARTCFACGAPLDPALAGLRTGALFASRFEILGSLGRGGMGMVYKARDQELGETVAVKVLRPDVARESGRVEHRFRAEIRLARRVRHQNVCSMYGDGEDRGLRYICMEFIDGENLARVSRSGGGLPVDEAWDVILQVASGLRAIHQAGVVHRDLKTANLMRDRHQVVRVMDFGIAKHHEGTTGGGPTVTATGALMGTPEYMSPEQLRGEPVDFRSDLYSFGIVVFELFTGTLPFRGETPVATILRQLQDPPKLEVPRLPSALRPVLRRALAKDPAERYANAEQMRAVLQDARRGVTPGPDPRDLLGETRPVPRLQASEPAPVTRIAAGLASVTALAWHLLSAGGVAGASPVMEKTAPIGSADIPIAVPAPPPSTSPPKPRLASAAMALPAPAPFALTATPPPVAEDPAVAEPVVVHPPSSRPDIAFEPHRIYEEDEVDVPPRRVEGMGAGYPEWGPELDRGESVSIRYSFVVTEAGDVTEIQVEDGGGALEAVLLAISRWKFEPGIKDGLPVKVRVRSTHTFVGRP